MNELQCPGCGWEPEPAKLEEIKKQYGKISMNRNLAVCGGCCLICNVTMPGFQLVPLKPEELDALPDDVVMMLGRVEEEIKYLNAMAKVPPITTTEEMARILRFGFVDRTDETGKAYQLKRPFARLDDAFKVHVEAEAKKAGLTEIDWLLDRHREFSEIGPDDGFGLSAVSPVQKELLDTRGWTAIKRPNGTYAILNKEQVQFSVYIPAEKPKETIH